MADDSQKEEYRPKDAIGATIEASMITGSAGFFISTIQNTLTRQNVGALGVLTRTGGTVAVFAAMGGAYEFTKTASANLRQKDDTWNTTWGGLVSGGIMGLRFRSAPAVLGYGSALAIIVSAFSFTGGKLMGKVADESVDEVSRKEYIRKNRRRPIEQTINELGEGRGIYGPGYAERRAERLQERYGIEVPAQQ